METSHDLRAAAKVLVPWGAMSKYERYELFESRVASVAEASLARVVAP